MDLGLGGRVVMVTGGSQGIGRATAAAFAREGARLALCARNEETLQGAAGRIAEETGAEVLAVAADVSVPADIRRFVDAAVARFGGVDVLVNNADSVTHQGDFFELTDEDWLEKYAIKVLAPIRFVRLVAPHMRAGGWGRIINISGDSARKMRDGGWAKGTTQAGLVNLSKKLSYRLGRYGITVNVIEPGRVLTDGRTKEGRSRTEIWQQAIAEAAAREGVSHQEMERRELSRLVIGRQVQPDDVADAILFLASQRAGAITGEVLVVDGGETRAVRF